MGVGDAALCSVAERGPVVGAACAAWSAARRLSASPTARRRRCSRGGSPGRWVGPVSRRCDRRRRGSAAGRLRGGCSLGRWWGWWGRGRGCARPRPGGRLCGWPGFCRTICVRPGRVGPHSPGACAGGLWRCKTPGAVLVWLLGVGCRSAASSRTAASTAHSAAPPGGVRRAVPAPPFRRCGIRRCPWSGTWPGT